MDQQDFENNLDKVLQRLEERRIVVKPSKCRLGLSEVEYVELKVNGDSIRVTTERQEVIRAILLPETVTQLRSILGLINYVRDFNPLFAEHAAPPYELLKGKVKKTEQINWTTLAKKEVRITKAAGSGESNLME